MLIKIKKMKIWVFFFLVGVLLLELVYLFGFIFGWIFWWCVCSLDSCGWCFYICLYRMGLDNSLIIVCIERIGIVYKNDRKVGCKKYCFFFLLLIF